MSMQVEYKLKLGQDEFLIKAEAKTQAEFFEKMSFFSSIPKVGPGGETDLKLLHRTPQGYNYYSLVSEKAGMEYKFGQSKENIGNLFGKGWEPLHKREATDSGVGGQNTTNVAPIGVPQQAIQPQQATPTPTAQVPTQQVTPTPTPTAAAPTTPVATNPAQVQSVANDVLARFGIKQG